MSVCITTNSNGDLIVSPQSVDTCLSYILISSDEYESGLLTDSFNPELYDLAYGAVLQSLVIGLSIGWVIAIIMKLKR